MIKLNSGQYKEASIGNAPLAANNLLGEIPMQMAVLALVGLVMVKGAIAFLLVKRRYREGVKQAMRIGQWLGLFAS